MCFLQACINMAHFCTSKTEHTVQDTTFVDFSSRTEYVLPIIVTSIVYFVQINDNVILM